MNHFDRPKRPRGWVKGVKDAQKNLKKDVKASGSNPLPDNAVPPLWREKLTFFIGGKQLTAKAIFSKAQHGICGYCAERIVGNETGDLDHFRPTRAITRSILNAGEELDDDVSQVKDRRLSPTTPYRPAWWDLAYAWDNYVFACNLCNRTWKQDLFLATHSGASYDGPRDPSEIGLLLNPFDDTLDELTKAFEFDEYGIIRGITDRGQATVETCGLDRPSLVPNRNDVVNHIKELCANLLRPRSPQDQKDRYKRLVERGAFSQPHAMVVRQTAETQLKKTWAEIEKAAL
jgi:hypothetical protein